MAHETRLDKLAGGSAFRLEVAEDFADWSTGAGDYFDASRLAVISIHRGRSNALSQPGPGTCSLTVAGGLASPSAAREIELAAALRLRLDPDAQTAIFGHAIAGATRFVGRVTDMGPARVTTKARVSNIDIPIIATSILSRLDNTPGPYDLAGLNDKQALDAVLVDVWNTDGAFEFGAWTVSSNPWRVYHTRTASTKTLAASDASGDSPSAALALIAASYDGVVIEKADGTIDWVRGDNRSEDEWHLPTQLPTSAVIDGLEATKHISDLITEADVGWGAGGTSIKFGFNDVSVVGQLVLRVDTRIAVGADAQDLADQLVARYGAPIWRLGSVTVDLLALIEAGDAALAETLLALDCERPVEITGTLPASTPAGVARRYVIGTVDEAISATGWKLTFGLIDQWLLDRGIQWRDWPAGVTWADVPAGVTWADARTYLPA